MSLSHSRQNQSTNNVLSGAAALRAHFDTRQILKLKEASEVLGISYPHFYRRVQAGTLALRIRKNEVGERYVLLDDLIAYIFPPSEPASSSPSPAKKKPGRPRKALSGQEGGA